MDDTRFTDATLHDAETNFQQALLHNDVAALDRVIHAEARFTGPDGVTIDKAADLAEHRAGSLTLDAVDELHRDLQVIDGVGLTRTTLRLAGRAGDQQLDLVLAYTRVWTPADGRWQIIAAHGGVGRPG